MTSESSANPFSRFLLVLAALACLIGWRAFHPPSTFAAEGIDADWDASVRLSRFLHQPAVVLYTADWCPACQALHASALSDPAVREELSKHTFVTVDLTQQAPTAVAHCRAAGVSGIPTLIRYDADGHETARTHGMPADALAEWLRHDE
jgi:thiol:disulfide interchange protein